MRKIFTVLILSFIPLLAFSQKDFKLVEQSQKEKPEWLTLYNHKEALMIQANRAASLEDAKNSVMTSLLNNIASSVAVQITSKTDVNVDWSVSGENDVYNEDIKTTTTTEIADMPALQGISLSKAETYWEKYHNKKTDETYYDYYILYPFTYQDLENLIEEYNKAKTLDKYPDEWKVFASHDYIYDIQSEKKDANKSEAELVNNLLDVARANIAKQIQVKVKDNSSINGKTTFATDIDVTLLLTKSHFNPHVNKIYAIAYVNKQEAARFYKRQTDVIFNDVEKHLSVADTYVETGFVAKAKDELKKTEQEFAKLEKPVFFMTLFALPDYELQEVLKRRNELEQTVKRKIADMEYGINIYVECNADMFGQKYPNLQKELKAKLSETGCSFTDDKASATWAVIINANSREYNKVNLGNTSNYFSYVDAEITLEKVVAGKTVYEDMITEKGGHTHGFTEAARDAYKKISPKIIELVTENIK